MFKRTDRLKELFFREVNLALQDVHGLNSHGIVTLTGVELVDDGKMLHVYFSVFGGEYDKTRTAALLTRSIYQIRAGLKKRLRLRVIPAIMFKYDSTPEEAARIETIFDKIKAEKKDEDTGS
jgi:ribosome-binding factor A